MKEKNLRLFKRQFVTDLAPFFEMLGNLYNEMNVQDWVAMVRKTELSFKNNPTQYLGSDIPPRPVTVKILGEIVNEFLNYYNIRDKKELSALN